MREESLSITFLCDFEYLELFRRFSRSKSKVVKNRSEFWTFFSPSQILGGQPSSVDRNSLWQLVASLGIPPTILSLFMALYTDILSCVRVDGLNSEWFPILSGVLQGCAVAPDLFLAPMDWLMKHTTHSSMVGTTI